MQWLNQLKESQESLMDWSPERQESWDIFVEKGFPTIKDEEWKYTNLKKVIDEAYALCKPTGANVSAEDLSGYTLNIQGSIKLYFVDGVFDANLSDAIPEGVELITMRELQSQKPDIFNTYFNKAIPEKEALTSMNKALYQDGLAVVLGKGEIVEPIIELYNVYTESQDNRFAAPRNLYVLGENSSVVIVERFCSLNGTKVFTNVVTEAYLKDGARLKLFKIQNDHANSVLVDNTWIEQGRNTYAQADTFSFSGGFIRNNLNFRFNGSNSEAHMRAVTIADEDNLIDHHTYVDHAVPHCYSNQMYKGIYDSACKGVFNGKVMVRPHAQKTNAFQQNNNLLLSKTAQLDTKPQLEIFADDVKCSHGCTVGQLDKDALFFMRSRGIGEKEAKALLTYAFANESLANIQIDELQEAVKMMIAKKLNVDIEF